MANAAVDLLTFEEFLTWSGIKPENHRVNQDQVENLITAASRIFSILAGRRLFIQAQDIQQFRGHNGLVQQVRYPPIDDASENAPVIEFWNWNTWETAGATTYPREFDYVTGQVRMTNSGFGRGILWRITYTGGWEQTDLPEDIKQATFDLVQRAHKRAEGKQGVLSDGKADQNVSYDLHKLANEVIRSVANGYRVIYN